MVQNYWFLYDYLKENEFRHFGNLKRQNDSFSPYGSGSGLGNLEISIFSCATWPILQVDKCQRQAREFYSTIATDLVGMLILVTHSKQTQKLQYVLRLFLGEKPASRVTEFMNEPLLETL